MNNPALNDAMESIYASLKNDNEELDERIANLKKLMTAQGMASIEADPEKLAQQNRQGRKMMQSYFKKRGVTVTFAEKKA